MSRAIEGTTFATPLTKRGRFYSPIGSTEANDYQIQIDKKGHKVLKLVGTHDIYEEIQSYKDECSIENILARAAAGDVDALNRRQGFYADITETPANLAEAQNAILKLSAEFNKLPAEIREKFDNSKERFVQLFGTDEFNELMGWTSNEAEKSERQSFVPDANNISNEILTPEVNKE